MAGDGRAGDQEDRDEAAIRLQAFSQLQTGHPRHVMIQDQAGNMS